MATLEHRGQHLQPLFDSTLLPHRHCGVHAFRNIETSSPVAHNWPSVLSEWMLTNPGGDGEASEERVELLENLNALTNPLLAFLGLIWLGLIILGLVQELPASLEAVTYVIWALFVVDFLVELAIAPAKLTYLRANWLTVVALALPVLRVLVVFRALRLIQTFRAVRALSLARLLSSTNRGLASLRTFLGHRQLGYVIAATVVVTLAGAAGIYVFERGEVDDTGRIENFGDALWWSAMMITTMGSDYWPRSWEGRLVALLLAVYGFAVFGYVTARIASAFIRSEARSAPSASSRIEEEEQGRDGLNRG